MIQWRMEVEGEQKAGLELGYCLYLFIYCFGEKGFGALNGLVLFSICYDFTIAFALPLFLYLRR